MPISARAHSTNARSSTPSRSFCDVRVIRVVLAESRPEVRDLILAALRADPEIEIVGVASTGAEALRLTRRLNPDIVVMATRMPKLDGYEAAKEIMIHAPTPIVLVATEADGEEANLSMQALRAGALALVTPPSRASGQNAAAAQCRFASTIKAMSQVKVVRQWPARTPRSIPQPGTGRRCAVRLVAIAAST